MEEMFNKLKKMDDYEKWKWLIKNQWSGVIVMLDNDDTFITHIDYDGYASFQEYIGWSDGVFVLLDSMGIKCDCV